MLTFDSFFTDFRQSFRSLKREKAFTLSILLTFALCLGANVVIFAVVHSVVMSPLSFPAPEQLVITYNSYNKLGIDHSASSVPNIAERKGLDAFTAVAAFRHNTSVVGEAGSPVRVTAMNVTGEFFKVLGVQPVLGRFHLPEEDFYGKSDVVVLSYEYWKSNYGDDASILGKKITVDGYPNTVIGVLPRGFHYLSTRAPLWKPMPFNDQERDPRARHSNSLDIIARLRPGVSIEQAQAQVNALNERLSKDDPGAEWASGAGFRTTVAGLREDHIAQIRPSLLLLQAGAALLLLIGMVNVVNLLVVRASGRTKELAVRRVLGAGRRNLAVQFIGETTLLGFLGGLLGLALGALALKGITHLGVEQLPLGADVSLSWSVALSALGVAILVGAVLAVPLVMFGMKTNLAPALSVESRSGTTTRSTQRLRHSLIVAQIALAFVLLVNAALLAFSFKKILAVQPGFKADNVIVARVSLSWKEYQDNTKRLGFVTRWLDTLRTIPGVTAAGLGTSLPIIGETGNLTMLVEGHAPAPGEAARAHHLGAVTGDYYKALGITLHEGRYLTSDDSQVTKPVCVIDDAFAKRYWPNGTALGHRISIGVTDQGENALVVVGVVGRVKQLGLTETDPMGMLYYPVSLGYPPFSFVAVVRTQQDPASIAPMMRQKLREIDPGLPLDDVRLMESLVDDSLLLPRSMMLLASIFAGIALLLAGIGVYGVLAFAVAQRRREIGVRLALGAMPAHILQQFLSLGGVLLVAGTLLGIVGAWFMGRAMTSLLFGVSPADPLIYFGTAVLLGIVVFAASVLPARRAAAVPVMDALRND